MKKTMVLFLCLWMPSLLGAVPLAKKAAQFYQKALEAYLAGDYEQAILLDSQALEINPQYKKAKSLLEVLVEEKERIRKAEIWLRGEEKQQPRLSKSGRPQPVVVQRGLDKEKLQELENRIQTVALLMERDSQDRFHELSEDQAKSTSRMEEMAKTLNDQELAGQKTQKEISFASLLSLLALLISLFALWVSRKTRAEQKRQLALLNRINPMDSLGNVVNIHK